MEATEKESLQEILEKLDKYEVKAKKLAKKADKLTKSAPEHASHYKELKKSMDDAAELFAKQKAQLTTVYNRMEGPAKIEID